MKKPLMSCPPPPVLSAACQRVLGRQRRTTGPSARENSTCTPAPQVEKEKFFVRRCPLLYKPFKKSDARGGYYCMGCSEWKKGNSSQAGDHLMHCHPDKWARVNRPGGGGQNDTMSASSSQSKVQTKLHHHQVWRGDALHRGHKFLTGFLVRGLRPFNAVDDEGFKDFVSAIALQYKLPTTRTVCKYMGAIFGKGKALAKGFLAPLTSNAAGGAASGLTACLVTNAWAARNGKSYNGTLATTLDDDFRARLICLDMAECQKKHHTAAVITDLLAKTMEDFNIPAASVFRTVHDAGSNVKKGA